MYAGVVGLAAEFPNDNPSMHRGAIWVCDALTGRPRAVLPPPPPERPLPVTALPVVAPELLAAAIAVPSAVPSSGPIAGPIAEERAPETVVDEDATRRALHLEELHEEPPATPRVEPAFEAPELAEPTPITTLVEEAVLEALAEAAEEPMVVEEIEIGEASVEGGEGIAPVFEVIEEVSDGTSSLPPPSDDPFVTLVCTLADVAIGAGAEHVASLLPALLFDARVEGPVDGELDQILRGAGVWDGALVDPTFVATTNAWRAILRGTSDDFSACPSMLDEWAAELLARLLAAPAKAPTLRQELRSRGVAAFGLAV